MALHAIDVFKQFRIHISPHWVQDHVDTFPASKLGCRDKIGVRRNKHDLVHEPLIGQGGNVESDSDINALLAHMHVDVRFLDLIKSLLFAK